MSEHNKTTATSVTVVQGTDFKGLRDYDITLCQDPLWTRISNRQSHVQIKKIVPSLSNTTDSAS